MSEAHLSKPPIRRQITATSHTPPQLGVVYQVAISHFVALTSHTPNFWGCISDCN